MGASEEERRTHQRAETGGMALLYDRSCSESALKSVLLSRNLFQNEMFSASSEIEKYLGQGGEPDWGKEGGWRSVGGMANLILFHFTPPPSLLLLSSFSPSLLQFATDHGRIGIFCFAQREWPPSGAGVLGLGSDLSGIPHSVERADRLL